MKTPLAIALLLGTAPVAALALPAAGDMIGTNPTDAAAALEKAGCLQPVFETEDGLIEAKCHDAANARWEVYIDPASGLVAKVKADD